MIALRTLVVDDEISVARVHSEFVSGREGFTVVGEAHTGSSALAEIERLSPDLVLLDIYLPDISGLDVLRRLRTGRSPGVDIIAVTAARDLESVRQAAAAGVRHYLVKPFPLSSLGERLDDVRRYRERLERTIPGQRLDQHAVDELLTGPSSATRLVSLPKGLTAATLARVLAELEVPGDGWSAAEIAGRVGLSRVGARRYLEHLLAAGNVVVVPRYGSIGRPENLYRLRGA
jgi:two-component system CitB family response regulator